MRALITWGSKHGGTEGIGRILGQALEEQGVEVVAASVDRVSRLDGFDAVIIGGGLYANRWPGNARRFVRRHVKELRKKPVWFFSSGPLDDSADRKDIPAPTELSVLMERVGARGHVTFGGRLEPDVKGFPASAMAKTSSGDWRNPERIRAWAATLAAEIPVATPGTPVEHPARSWWRSLGYAVLGWAPCAIILGALLPVSRGAALAVHLIAAPVIFGGLAWRYFRVRGAREPLPTALAWTAVVALLDLAVVAGGMQRDLAIFRSVAGTWIPFALIFLTVWGTGGMLATLPWPKPEKGAGPPASGTLAHGRAR